MSIFNLIELISETFKENNQKKEEIQQFLLKIKYILSDFYLKYKMVMEDHIDENIGDLYFEGLELITEKLMPYCYDENNKVYPKLKQEFRIYLDSMFTDFKEQSAYERTDYSADDEVQEYFVKSIINLYTSIDESIKK